MEASLLQKGISSSDQEGLSKSEVMRQQRMMKKLEKKFKPPQRGVGVAQLERLRLQERLTKNKANEESGAHISDQNPDFLHRALLSQVPPSLLRDQHSALNIPPAVMNCKNNGGRGVEGYRVAGHQLTEFSCPYGPLRNGEPAGGIPQIQSSGNEHQRPFRSKMFTKLNHYPDNCDFCVQERINGMNAQNMEEAKRKADIYRDSRLRMGSGPRRTNNHQQQIIKNKEKEAMEIERNNNTMKEGSGRLMDDECGLSPPSKSRRSCNGESSSSAYNSYNKGLSFADQPTGVVDGEASSTTTATTTTTTITSATNTGEVLDLSLKLSCGY